MRGIPLSLSIYTYMTLASDVFKVKYIIADSKAVFVCWIQNLDSLFSNQIKFLEYKLILERYRKVLYLFIFWLNQTNNTKFRVDIVAESSHRAIVNWKIHKRSYSWMKGLFRDSSCAKQPLHPVSSTSSSQQEILHPTGLSCNLP